MSYSEFEWALQLQAPAAGTYEFRVYAGSTPLDLYTVTPQLTVDVLTVQNSTHNFQRNLLDVTVGSVSTVDPGVPSPPFTIVARVSQFTDLSLILQGPTAPNRGMTTYFVRGASNEQFVFGLSSTGSDSRELWASSPRRSREYVAFVVTLAPTYTMTPYTSLDGVTWEVAATTEDWGSSSSIFDTTADLVVGSSAGYSGTAAGRIHWVEMRSGTSPTGGTLVWRMDPNDYVGGTSWVDPRSRTWTPSNTAALIGEDVALSSVIAVANSSHAISSDNVPLGALLAMQDGTHLHSADNVSLNLTLLVDDSPHLHSADNVVLVPSLIVATGTHLHAADNIALSLNVIVANGTHLHAADNAVLTYNPLLAALDSTHLHSGDNTAVIPALLVDSSTHLHSAANVDLIHNPVLVVAAASHLHSVNNISFNLNEIVVDNNTHLHDATNIDLFVNPRLAPADSTHLHSAESLLVTSDVAITVAAGTHLHSAENTILVPALVVGGAVHLHSADNTDLLPAGAVGPASSVHLHTAENIVLRGALLVDDATHLHLADDIILTPAGTLAIAITSHLHTAGNVVLVFNPRLVIANATHLHTATEASSIVKLNDAIALYLGNTPVEAVYVGATKVWP